jgi:D-alanyl-D-alanine carboxypeptidase/D-alanyl-D-alanine-endopeptidase (penicillin-binding protein 4)
MQRLCTYAHLVWWWVVCSGLLAGAQEVRPPATLAELQERLTQRLAAPEAAAAFWGVKIVSLDTGKTLFERDALKLFSPASNSKLFTVALALDRLGADYRIKTSLYAAVRPTPGGVLRGDLIVYGRGDPCLNARLHHEDIFAALEPLVAGLAQAGVRRIRGDLVGDESFFRGPRYGSGWEWEDLETAYGAEISALTINDNTVKLTAVPGDRAGAPCKLTLSPPTACITLTNLTRTGERGGVRRIHLERALAGNGVEVSGSLPLGAPQFLDEVPVHNPAALFLGWFREALKRRGISVDGGSRVVTWREGPKRGAGGSNCVELAALESLPMRDLAREVLKPSQNLYADLLLAQVGESARSNGTPAEATSEALGIQELERFLTGVGVGEGEVVFEEGSGLSRDNLTTPNAVVALLTHMSRHPAAEAYREALPIAGVDGTLKSRMKDTPAAGNVRAKTGTLRWANSLSGYVTTAAGERLVFSILLNRYQPGAPEHSARAEIDALAILLAQFTGRSG